jgi:hypothetical protein
MFKHLRALILGFVFLCAAASQAQLVAPSFVQCASRGQVTVVVSPTDTTLALVATTGSLEIYRWNPQSLASVDGDAVLGSAFTGLGRWLRIASTSASGGGGSANSLASGTISGITTRNDQQDYLITELSSSTAITVDWSKWNVFVNLKTNTTVSWVNYPTSVSLGRDLSLVITNSGSFTATFGAINGQTIKWHTFDGNAPTLPANTRSTFSFAYDRTNYWGDMDTAPIGAGQTTLAATQRVIGRNTAGAGAGEEVTLSQFLDWIGSPAQGDILFRGAAGWQRLGAGTSGFLLQSGGAGANPSWVVAPSGGGGSAPSGTVLQTNSGLTSGMVMLSTQTNLVAAVPGINYLAPVNPMTAITPSSTNYTIDASLGVMFSVINPSANFGLIITNGSTWQPISLGIRQDSTGTRYGMPKGTNWVFGADVTTNSTTGLSLSTNAGAWDWFRIMCVSNTYHVVGQTRGFLAP